MSRLKRTYCIGLSVIVAGLVSCSPAADDHVDCDTVRAMLEYNTEFNASIQQSANAGDPEGSSVSRYQEWAERLQQYADEIHDDTLAAEGDTMARLADETVGFVETSRAGPAGDNAVDDAREAQTYANLAEQFQESVTALDQACPGAS